MGTKAWPKLLIDYQNECRKSKPLPTLSDLDTEIEKQKYQVHLQELHQINSFSGLTLFSSDTAGLVAAQELFSPNSASLLLMYRDEYQEFCKENGLVIAGCSYSSFYSSFGEEISGRELNRHKFENTIFEGKVLAKYTFDDEATYIRQSVGRSSGILSGYGEQHLWIWDGAELKLFARTVLEWVS